MKSIIGSRVSRQVTFVGPFGVGKTTGVFSLCGASVSSTDVRSTFGSRGRGRRIKPTTTVGLEVGEWTAPDGRRVTIVGTPSQERFDVVRQSAMPRSSGVVLWLFGDHADGPLDAELWLDFIAREIAIEKITVAVTRLPGDDTFDERFDEFARVVAAASTSVQVVAADPREAADVERVVCLALKLDDAAGVSIEKRAG